MSSRSLAARNRLGAALRNSPNDSERIVDARRDLAEARIADAIERIVADAPPLTDNQRARLAAMLAPAVAR